MLAATIVCIATAWAAEEAGAKEPAAEPAAFQAAWVDTARLFDAIDLAPIYAGVRRPGPTQFGLHYWVDPEYSNNPHGVQFVIAAVLDDTDAARAHYDRLRARVGHPPLPPDEAALDRFAVRFNADAGATDVTLTRGNIYLAFRASGERDGLVELAEILLASLDNPRIAPPGPPEPIPALTLTRRTGQGMLVEIAADWDGDPGEPLPRLVLYRPDGEYLAIADADGLAELETFRFDTVDELVVIAGWEDNRWRRWEIRRDDIIERPGNE